MSGSRSLNGAGRSVFVYGTLMPGHLRWPLIADGVVALRRATIAGRLFDTGRDYPALVLDGDEEVQGWIFELDGERTEELLELLDEIEGVAAPELYRRTTVVATDHEGVPGEVHVYEYVRDPSRFSELDGRWRGA